eukprot:scaffold2043_cov149-Skeletonema_menzelii.AAC.15
MSNPSAPGNSSSDYSVNYLSSSRTEEEDSILLPGQQPTRRRDDDKGVVIKPTPTQIVIKTRLVKQKHNPFTDDSSQVPSSFSNISAVTQNQEEMKVFINVCTHSMIALPSQRKTLDENGEEIEGWRLPMSMGDLRPFYDKRGNACIAADSIVNPKIVQEMRADPSHFHFVCDLIIQCAERKFQHTRFAGKGLERSFKLPKMKYAAYVDEKTNLSILPAVNVKELRGNFEGLSSDDSSDDPPRPVVAKQRVKGSGGRSAIIEEIQCSEKDSKDPPLLPKVRIQLFVTTKEDRAMIPLFDFLGEMADMDQSSSSPLLNQPWRTSRKMIQSPQLKPCEEDNLCKSQLLKIPLPIKLKNGAVEYIVAKCSYQSGLTRSDLPTINASAFLLTISKTEMNSATECVLPFAVDTHQISARYETKSGTFEINMPILQSALDFEQNADPGTRQWDIQSAFRVESVHANPRKQCDDESRASSYLEDDFGRNQGNNEDEDTLPEDAFHSRDIMSRHLLQKQEEMQKSQQQKSVKGREGADTEYIDADDFRPQGKHLAKKKTRDPMLHKAEELLKQHVPFQNSGNLALALV